jgi:hypothetical protein
MQVAKPDIGRIIGHTVVNAVVNIVSYGFGFDIGYCIDCHCH